MMLLEIASYIAFAVGFVGLLLSGFALMVIMFSAFVHLMRFLFD